MKFPKLTMRNYIEGLDQPLCLGLMAGKNEGHVKIIFCKIVVPTSIKMYQISVRKVSW
jgi:hypothetical protein